MELADGSENLASLGTGKHRIFLSAGCPDGVQKLCSIMISFLEAHQNAPNDPQDISNPRAR